MPGSSTVCWFYQNNSPCQPTSALIPLSAPPNIGANVSVSMTLSPSFCLYNLPLTILESQPFPDVVSVAEHRRVPPRWLHLDWQPSPMLSDNFNLQLNGIYGCASLRVSPCTLARQLTGSSACRFRWPSGIWSDASPVSFEGAPVPALARCMVFMFAEAERCGEQRTGQPQAANTHVSVEVTPAVLTLG